MAIVDLAAIGLNKGDNQVHSTDYQGKKVLQ